MEAVSSKTVLADSNQKTRPPFTTYLMTDSNAGGHSVKQIEEKRRIRGMKLPPVTGKHDVDSFQTDLQDEGFKKWNDDGDHHATAPYRSYDNIIDPVSGFVSAGGDVDRSTGHHRIRSLAQLNRTPQSAAPRAQNSIRTIEQAAPPELKRGSTYCPGGPTAWNSRKLSNTWIKSQLGAMKGLWKKAEVDRTEQDRLKSEVYVRFLCMESGEGGPVIMTPGNLHPRSPRQKSMYVPKPPSEESKTSRDHLSNKYMYSSSTQRSYEEVPWDTMLAPKTWAPTHTAEDKPDMISHRWSNKKYDSAAQEWQRRRGYYKNQAVSFGSIGAENLEEIDNSQEPFDPLTVKRVLIPRPSETAHRPNIPGYKGCTLWKGKYAPANAHPVPTPHSQPTTALIHKPMPLSQQTPGTKRGCEMSRMITLVPPCNPFNSIEKDDVIVS